MVYGQHGLNGAVLGTHSFEEMEGKKTTPTMCTLEKGGVKIPDHCEAGKKHANETKSCL